MMSEDASIHSLKLDQLNTKINAKTKSRRMESIVDLDFQIQALEADIELAEKLRSSKSLQKEESQVLLDAQH